MREPPLPLVPEMLRQIDGLAHRELTARRGQLTVSFASNDDRIVEWPVSYLAPACSFTQRASHREAGGVVCVADGEFHARLREMLAGLRFSPASTYEGRPVLRTELGPEIVALAYVDGPGVTLVDVGRRCVRYVTAGVSDARFEAARLVREVLRRQGEHRGEVTIHAGAVFLDGRVWVIPGAKGAGKTTTVCAMLEHVGADFVANDRVHLSATDGGHVAQAWPMTTRIGLGTCNESQQLKTWLQPTVQPAYPQTGWDPRTGLTESDVAELLAAADGPKVELTTTELIATMGCKAEAGGPVAGLLMPKRNPRAADVSVRTGEFGQTIELLLEQAFTPHDDAYPDWLGLRTRSVPELARAAADTLARLAADVPLVEVEFADARSLGSRLRQVLEQAVRGPAWTHGT
jgi:hypothetical protein